MNNKRQFYVIIAISALLLMWYAFFNGYPLVTSDSGAYIHVAFDFEVLRDRSFFYSLFMGAAGLSTLAFAGVRGSLWIPIFVQCVIIAWLLIRYYRLISGNAPGIYTWFLALLLIIVTTGVSWSAAYAMPDVFAGILLLTLLLYLFDKQAHNSIKAMYLGILTLAILVHNSHFLIAPLSCGLLWLFFLLTKQQDIWKRLTHVLILSAGC